MGKKETNDVIREQFEKLEISSQSFQSGGIYITRDTDVLFPSRSKVEDKPRLVVVIGQEKDLNDPLLPHISVIPITTRLDGEISQDVPVEAGSGNLNEKSLVKAGMVQPILKTKLGKKIGELDSRDFEEVKAMVFINLGFAESNGEDETEENHEEVKG